MCEPVSAGAAAAAAGEAAAAGGAAAAAGGTAAAAGGAAAGAGAAGAAGAGAAGAGAAAGAAGTGLSMGAWAQLAGAALSAASMYANKQAQNNVIDARNNINTAQAARQDKLQLTADTGNTKTQDTFSKENQDAGLAANFAGRNSFMQENMPNLSTSGVPVSAGAPQNVKTDLGSRIADALQYGRNLATSQARMGAYGGNQFNNQITLGRNQQQLNRTTDASGRSSDIAGLQLGVAPQAGAADRSMADIFRLSGNSALMYGMTRPAGVGTQAPAPVREVDTSALRY